MKLIIICHIPEDNPDERNHLAVLGTDAETTQKAVDSWYQIDDDENVPACTLSEYLAKQGFTVIRPDVVTAIDCVNHSIINE